MEFENGEIEGVRIRPLTKHLDERGFLVETYRTDEFPEDVRPVMSYVSSTEPGQSRGPHEHADQTDTFSFIGPGNFKIYLWDNRNRSETFGNRMIVFAGEDRHLSLTIPPGIVHAYRNISRLKPGLVINYPNRLYAGAGKKERVDEVRHEDAEDHFYRDFQST